MTHVGVDVNSTSSNNINNTNTEEQELPKADYADTSHPIFEALKTRFNKHNGEPITYEDLQLYLLEGGQIKQKEYEERTTRIT